jgi:hypothetical protein
MGMAGRNGCGNMCAGRCTECLVPATSPMAYEAGRVTAPASGTGGTDHGGNHESGAFGGAWQGGGKAPQRAGVVRNDGDWHRGEAGGCSVAGSGWLAAGGRSCCGWRR